MDDLARWSNVTKVFQHGGGFVSEQHFVPGLQHLDNIKNVPILIIGSGGLGCELLKDLAMMAFQNLHVIDMDTIDVSNLNRQFLFRIHDVGESKAKVAAAFIEKRVPGCEVTPYFCKIQDKDADFYRDFKIVVCGLDSIEARRWMNDMLISLLEYDDNGDLEPASLIPIVDGGTEGFKGNARVIFPSMSPCIECTLGLYPPQENFPMCTIAHTPRLPEHCVEYVRILLWPKENPFDASIDGDDPEHIKWIHEQALIRAKQYNIGGVTYRLTQGVVKRIIPAVASTNAIIAAACANEVFKIVTSCNAYLNNYVNFQDNDSATATVVQLEKKEDCSVCSRKPVSIEMPITSTLQNFYDLLIDGEEFQMKQPSIYSESMKALYMPIIESSKLNLKKNIREFADDSEVVELCIADVTRTNLLNVIVRLIQPMEQ